MAIGLLSAAIVASGVIGVKLLLGDALRSYHVQSSEHGPYEGQLLTMPFRSLLTTPLIHDVPLWKTVYTWGCVAFSLLSCFLLLRQWLHASRTKTDSGWLPLAAPWAIGNTGFTLCLGGIWGFHEFHRFMVPALPALLLAYRNVLPRKPGALLLVASLSVAPALYGMHRQAARLHDLLPSPEQPRITAGRATATLSDERATRIHHHPGLQRRAIPRGGDQVRPGADLAAHRSPRGGRRVNGRHGSPRPVVRVRPPDCPYPAPTPATRPHRTAGSRMRRAISSCSSTRMT